MLNRVLIEEIVFVFQEQVFLFCYIVYDSELLLVMNGSGSMLLRFGYKLDMEDLSQKEFVRILYCVNKIIDKND